MYDPVKEYLASVNEARLEAKRLGYKLQRLEAAATRVTSSLTGMPGGGGGDKESLLVKLADMRDRVETARYAAEQREEEVSAFLDRLPSSLHRMIMKLRYCDCLEWTGQRRSVQSELLKAGQAYEERQIYRHHGLALEEAREIYKEIFNEESRCS